MTTRSVLVSFPGYPFDVARLMPDYRLVSLAGSLIDAGHATHVRDLGTPETLARLFPAEARDTARALADVLHSETPPNPLLTLGLLWRIRATDRAYRVARRKLCDEVARDIARDIHLDFVVFHVAAADDVAPALAIADTLKSVLPGLRVAAIGAFVEAFPLEMLRECPAFDCLCTGDPTASMPALADAIAAPERWPGVPNLYCRQPLGRAPRLRASDATPSRAWGAAYHADAYPAFSGGHKIKVVAVDEQAPFARRGGQGLGAGVGDLKSPLDLAEEMASLSKSHGTHVFQLLDVDAPNEHVVAVADALRQRGLPIAYVRTGRAEFADSPHLLPNVVKEPGRLFARLRDSGCVGLTFPVGSGSQRLLDDHFGREVSICWLEKALCDAKQAGLFTVAGLTHPLPADDLHTRAETLRFIERTLPDAAPVGLPRVVPGTAWHDKPAAFGFQMDSKRTFANALRAGARFPLPPGRWQAPAFRMQGLSAGQIIAAQESLIREIEEFGVVACASELPLLAHITGYGGSLTAFARRVQCQMMMGDADGIGSLVDAFNRAARTPVRASLLRPYSSLREAVGN